MSCVLTLSFTVPLLITKQRVSGVSVSVNCLSLPDRDKLPPPPNGGHKRLGVESASRGHWLLHSDTRHSVRCKQASVSMRVRTGVSRF